MGLAGLKETLQTLPMSVTVPLWHENRDRFADDFIRRVRKGELGRSVEIDDVAVPVRGDDRVARRLREIAKAFFT